MMTGEYQETVDTYRRHVTDGGWAIIDSLLHDVRVMPSGRAVDGEFRRIADALAAAGIEEKPTTIRTRYSVGRWAAVSEQVRTIRSRGWSLAARAYSAGWTQDMLAAHIEAGGLRKDINKVEEPKTIDDEWAAWIGKLNSLLLKGTELANATDEHAIVGTAASLGYNTYLLLSEKAIEADIRRILEEAS